MQVFTERFIENENDEFEVTRTYNHVESLFNSDTVKWSYCESVFTAEPDCVYCAAYIDEWDGIDVDELDGVEFRIAQVKFDEIADELFDELVNEVAELLKSEDYWF